MRFPRLPRITDEDSLIPPHRRIQLLVGAAVFVGLPFAVYALAATRYIAQCAVNRPTCLEHRKAGCTIDGNYSIRLGARETEATCDMHTDGGGWTLVGNYLHRAAAVPAAGPLPISDHFPLENGTALGMDELGTPSWGHLSNAALSEVPFTELRFWCRTSAHDRVVDFAISNPKCLSYFRTGRGNCVDPASKPEVLRTSRALADHLGRLPASADTGWKDQGDGALTNYPFYMEPGTYAWSPGTAWNRFECDDHSEPGATQTHHQIWAR